LLLEIFLIGILKASQHIEWIAPLTNIFYYSLATSTLKSSHITFISD
jgi:hypothetical protein